MSLTSARRAAIDRWIIGLTPFIDMVSVTVTQLGLGEPRLSTGPAFMGRHLFDFGGDRIRKGAVWWIGGKNCGFHVDFLRKGLIIESWTGSRQVQAIVQEPDPGSLGRDLRLCLALSGLADLSTTVKA